MKRLFSLILILLFTHLTFSQEDGPYFSYYDNGQLKIEGQYLNSQPTGKWKYYYESGQLSSIYSYTEGKLDIEFVTYFEDGVIKSQTLKEGDEYISKSFYENGKLLSVSQYKTGYYKEYLQNGKLKVEATYVDFELVGDWKSFYENGALEWLVTYKDDYREGVYKQYYSDGILKLEGLMSKDKKEGFEKRYSEVGFLEWEGEYMNGNFFNTWIKYSADGDKVDKIKFKEDFKSNKNALIIPTQIPEGIIERVPIYPGCETFFTNKDFKKCMNNSIAKHIVTKFRTRLANQVGLSGRLKISVNFKIDSAGLVTDIKAKGPHPDLEAEAIRLISLLPQIQPGTLRGEQVTIPFSLPIIFQVE